jgi:hypothetical protein
MASVVAVVRCQHPTRAARHREADVERARRVHLRRNNLVFHSPACPEPVLANDRFPKEGLHIHPKMMLSIAPLTVPSASTTLARSMATSCPSSSSDWPVPAGKHLVSTLLTRFPISQVSSLSWQRKKQPTFSRTGQYRRSVHHQLNLARHPGLNYRAASGECALRVEADHGQIFDGLLLDGKRFRF